MTTLASTAAPYRDTRTLPVSAPRAIVHPSSACELRPAVRVTKRILDIAVAFVGLVLTAWIFPIIALLTKLDSPGPVFFRQRRAGALKHRDSHGRCTFETFPMYKFR